MRVIFSVEFIYRDKPYCGIVRVHDGPGGREYHVRIMNNRLDKWVYRHHVFAEMDGGIQPAIVHCPERVRPLRDAIHTALNDWLANRAVDDVPQRPYRRMGTSTNEYYVHSISMPKPINGQGGKKS